MQNPETEKYGAVLYIGHSPEADVTYVYLGNRGVVVEIPGQGLSTSRRFPVRGFSRGLWKSSTSAKTAARKFYYRPSVAGVKTFLWIGEKYMNLVNSYNLSGGFIFHVTLFSQARAANEF